MAFPSVVTPRGTSGALASSTTHSVTMPGGATTARGVLVILTADSAPTITTASSGWTKLDQINNGSLVGSAVFYKRPGVTLSALSIALSFAEEGTYVVLVFDDAEPSENPSLDGVALSGTNTNPPSLTPAGGARDYLWIAVRSGEAAVVATAAPASFSNLTSATGGSSGASTSTAERALNASSLDPGAFTSATEDCVAWTIAIPPAAPTFTVHDASASFAGAGAMSATGQATRQVAATFAGAGGMTAATQQTHATTASFAGAGSMTVGSGVDRPAAATFAGAGSMTAAGTRIHSASASFAGAGDMVSTPGQLAQATFAGSGSMTAATRQTHQVTAAFAGAGQLTSAGQSNQRIATAFAGAGQMAVVGTPIRPAAATFTGAGQMLADGRRVHPAQAAFAGSGWFTATGVRTRPAAVAFAGAGRLTASARLDRPGLNISLWAVTPSGLLPLPAREKLDLSRERNSVGSVSVDYPAGAPGFDLLRAGVANDRDVEVEIWLDGKQDGALRALLMQAAGDDNDARAVWRFSGHFLEWLLAEAIIYNQPAPADKGELVFAGSNAGEVMATVLNQAQARGALSGVTRDWTTSLDSSGLAWPQTVSGLKFSPRTTLLQVAQKLVDLDLAEFEMTRDRVLRLWAPGRRGVDRSTGNDPALFRHGRVTSWPVRHSVRDSATTVLVAGADGVYREATDATALARRGRRIEQGADANNLDSVAAVQAYAQHTIELVAPGQTEIRHPLTFGAGDPRPGAGFEIADKVVSERAGGVRLAVDLQQWTLSDSRGDTAGEVVLNDRIASRLERLRRQLDAIGSGAAVVGTSQPPSSDDTVPPAAPTGVTVDSLAYTEGIDTYATLLVGWAQVTTNASGPATPKAEAAQLILTRMQSGDPIAEDWTWAGAPQVVGVWNDSLLADFETSGGSDAEVWLADFVDDNFASGAAADDVAGYRVQWRPQSEGEESWRLGIDVAGATTTSASFGGVGAGIDVLVRVAAYDNSGNQSAWSGEVVILTATDDDAPPTPATPVAAPYLGQIKVTYDGKGSAGEAMPLDTDVIELHKSLASGFDPTDATAVDTFSPNIVGERVLTDLAYGVAVFVRLVARDRAGNRSATSAQASATPEKVVGDDVFDGAIGSAKLADLAVITAKIDNLAVNDAKFGSGSVGKLTAGTLSVAVTNAGIVRSGTSGQRYELDAAALRFYNSGGSQTVQLNGALNWIMGELRTGMSGTRMVINPDGADPDEMRFYPSSGSAYAKIETRTFVGQALIDMIGGTTRGDLKTGQAGCHPLEGYVRWGLPESTTPHSYAVANEFAVEATGPQLDFIVEQRFDNALDDDRKMTFQLTNSSGTGIANSLLWLKWGGVNQPWFARVNGNCGILFDTNSVSVVNGGGSFGPVAASAFNVNSSEAVKEDVADARALLDPLAVIRGARAIKFRYSADKWFTPPPTDEDPTPEPVPVEAPDRVGVLVEDLPDVLQVPIPQPDGTTSLGTDLASQVGVLWGALGQIQDQEIRTVAGRAALPNGTYQPGTVREVEVVWDETPLEVPTGGIVTVYAAIAWLGKTTARIVPGSITATGCTVEVRALAVVVPNAANPITVEAQALYLWSPPFSP